MIKLNKSQLVQLCYFIVGLTFIISGFAKSLDATFFANIIAAYGIVWLGYLSPVIIIMEVLIGALLLFTSYNRTSVLKVATIMVIGFTIIYTYGLITRNIHNCGCFGNIAFINDGPILLYSKNFILISLGCWGIKYTSNDHISQTTPRSWLFVFLLSIITTFTCGQTFSPIKRSKVSYKPKVLKDTELSKFIVPIKDKSQLVFLFSYTCPHCLNSIANLNEYENSNHVDTIIGLALGNSTEEAAFRKNFNATFNYKTIDSSIFQVTTSFPRAFLIRGDSIIMEYPGELPCYQLFPFPIEN